MAFIWAEFHKRYISHQLLRQFSLFCYFSHFSASPKYILTSEYHVHIWQVSPQLSCGDTWQMWKWCKESNRYFDRIENFAYGEINEQSFSNPHPCSQCFVWPLAGTLLTTKLDMFFLFAPFLWIIIWSIIFFPLFKIALFKIAEHFQIDFLQWKLLYYDSNFTEICSQGSNQQ